MCCPPWSWWRGRLSISYDDALPARPASEDKARSGPVRGAWGRAPPARRRSSVVGRLAADPVVGMAQRLHHQPPQVPVPQAVVDVPPFAPGLHQSREPQFREVLAEAVRDASHRSVSEPTSDSPCAAATADAAASRRRAARTPRSPPRVARCPGRAMHIGRRWQGLASRPERRGGALAWVSAYPSPHLHVHGCAHVATVDAVAPAFPTGRGQPHARRTAYLRLPPPLHRPGELMGTGLATVALGLLAHPTSRALTPDRCWAPRSRSRWWRMWRSPRLIARSSTACPR